MQNSDSIFYPMLKRYWWSPWEYIIGYNKTAFFIEGDWQGQHKVCDAKHLIEAYKKHTLDHVYYIPYKEEEE